MKLCSRVFFIALPLELFMAPGADLRNILTFHEMFKLCPVRLMATQTLQVKVLISWVHILRPDGMGGMRLPVMTCAA